MISLGGVHLVRVVVVNLCVANPSPMMMALSCSWTGSKSRRRSVRCVTCYGQTHWRTSAARRQRNTTVTTASGVAHISTGASLVTQAFLVSNHFLIFFRILPNSHLYVRSMFIMRHLRLTRSCTSFPDSSLSR